MARYKVMGPDGKTHVFEGPDGASPQEVEQFAAQAFGQMFPKASDTQIAAQRTVDDMSGPQRIAAGAGQRVDRLLDGLTGLVLEGSGHQGAVDAHKATVAEKKAIDKPLMATPGGTAGGVAADVGMTVIPAAKALGVAGKVANPLGRTVARLGAGGAVGAAHSAVQPVDAGESRGTNAMFGFGAGAVGQGAGDLVGAGINGLIPKSSAASRLAPDVQDTLTVGQIADKNTIRGRMANGIEEKAKSIPIVGDIIARQRAKAVDAWRNSVVERGTPDGFTPQGDNTRELLDSAYGEFQRQYGNALKGNPVAHKQAFESWVARAVNDPRRGMTEQQADEIFRKVMGYYDHMYGAANVGPNGARVFTVPATDAPQAKGFEAFLGQQARDYGKSTTPGASAMSGALNDIERAWTATYRRQLPLATRQQLNPLDQKYANFKTAERAAASVGNDQGAFTPAQMVNAVKARSGTSDFGRQTGLGQKDADAAKSVLQDRIPDSGTAGRWMAGLGATGAGAIDPITTTAALGTILAGTTKTGRNVMTGDAYTQRLLRALYADKAAQTLGAPLGMSMTD